jgi:hypothetical protein
MMQKRLRQLIISVALTATTLFSITPRAFAGDRQQETDPPQSSDKTFTISKLKKERLTESKNQEKEEKGCPEEKRQNIEQYIEKLKDRYHPDAGKNDSCDMRQRGSEVNTSVSVERGLKSMMNYPFTVIKKTSPDELIKEGESTVHKGGELIKKEALEGWKLIKKGAPEGWKLIKKEAPAIQKEVIKGAERFHE